MRALPVLDLTPAADLLIRTAAAVRADQLDHPTPCSPLSVRELLAHLLVATRMSAAAGTRRAPAGQAEVPVRDDGRWRGVLAERAAALAAAWARPQAWSGETTAGGVTGPAQEAGRVAAMELVLHGWDLAVATGQPFGPDGDAVDAVLELVLAWQHVEGREHVFGPVVPVAADAPPLHRALGLSGRDPGWPPAAGDAAGSSS